MTRKSQLILALMLTVTGPSAVSAAESNNNIIVSSANEVVAHVADGGQWSTAITLVNLSGAGVDYTVNFYADTGAPLPLFIVGIFNNKVASVAGHLNANGTTTIQTLGAPNQPTVVGWARIQGTGLLGGFAVFRSHVAGDKDSEAVVPIDSKFDHRFVLVFDNTNGFVTGAAIVNPSANESVFVTATFRDELGQQFDQQSFSMLPLTHSSFAFTTRFPQTANKKGTVEFFTASLSLAGVGLRFSPFGPFTSFHPLSAQGW
jgi:hypothetical protein